MPKPRQYFQLSFETPAAIADGAAAILVAHGALGSEVCATRSSVRARGRAKQVRLKAYFAQLGRRRLHLVTRMLEAAAMIATPAEVQVETLTDPGWATMWMTRFAPFIIGARWLVVPPWSHAQCDGRLRLIIQPGQGFGTGHHGSTAGVMRLLAELCSAHKFRHALDVGTGSGILSIAMNLLGVNQVTALEIDPAALENARENADLNHATGIRFSLVPLRSLRRRYDLIAANILSSTLIELAPALKRRLSPDGRLILAGILAREARAVTAAYRPELRCLGTHTDRGWSALVMGR